MEFLAAALILLWALVAGYLVVMVRSQRRLDQEISVLAEALHEGERSD